MNDDYGNDPDMELGELAFLQKKANSLIAYAVKMHWIEPGDAFHLYADVSGASIDTIVGVFTELPGEIDVKRKEYDATHGITQ